MFRVATAVLADDECVGVGNFDAPVPSPPAAGDDIAICQRMINAKLYH